MNRPLTGRDATLLLTGFFALVIAVNLVMARLAGATFGGKLAENGYVASQDYNRWQRSAAAQERLGWAVATAIEDGRLVVRTRGVAGAAVAVRAVHPLGARGDHDVAMRAQGPDRFVSAAPMAPGRWRLAIAVTRGDATARFAREVRR